MVPGIDRVVKNLINHIDVLAREERSVELKMSVALVSLVPHWGLSHP